MRKTKFWFFDLLFHFFEFILLYDENVFDRYEKEMNDIQLGKPKKFDEEINSLQDYDLYLKLVDKGEIAGIPEGLVTYYFDDSIKHISVNNKAMFFSAWKIYRKQRGYARLSILIALLVIIIQKYYKKINYKHKGKNL